MHSGLGFSSLAVEVSVAPEDESFGTSPFHEEDTAVSLDATGIFGFLKERIPGPPESVNGSNNPSQLVSRFSTSTYSQNATEELLSSAASNSSHQQMPALLEHGEYARQARHMLTANSRTASRTRRTSSESLKKNDLLLKPTFTEPVTASQDSKLISNEDTYTRLPKRRHTYSKSLSHIAMVADTDLDGVKPDTENAGAHQFYLHDPEDAIITTARVLPMTPARAHPIFRPPMEQTPSPTSSTELSPVARKMMADLRLQRTRAEREKRYGRWGNFTTSKLRH